MLWELMRTGSLPHWWEYLVLVVCFLIQAAGVTALAIMYVTRVPRSRKDSGRDSGSE